MRNYIVSSWNDADQYNYSGEQIGNRGRKSGRVHFNPDGSACVASYGDEPKTTKISIKDRILPQFKRLSTLQSQMVELEKEYKTTDMTCAEYSMLRDVIVCKIARAEVLYKKAISVRPDREETEDEMPDFNGETHYSSNVNDLTNTPIVPSSYPAWVDELPHTNSFKKILQKACVVVRKVVEFTQATKRYIKTLSEV